MAVPPQTPSLKRGGFEHHHRLDGVEAPRIILSIFGFNDDQTIFNGRDINLSHSADWYEIVSRLDELSHIALNIRTMAQNIPQPAFGILK